MPKEARDRTLKEEQALALKDFVNAGNGFYSLHNNSHVSLSSKTYREVMGGAYIGHPVVGDPVYRPRNRPRTKARFARQALHAQTLGFVHPLTREPVHVEAPLPPDLDWLIIDLRNRYGTI